MTVMVAICAVPAERDDTRAGEEYEPMPAQSTLLAWKRASRSSPAVGISAGSTTKSAARTKPSGRGRYDTAESRDSMSYPDEMVVGGVEPHMEENFPEIVLDFAADYAERIKQQFQSLGIATAAATPYELMVRHTSLKRRLIEARPRTVEFSREFVCPPQTLAGLNSLKAKIARGESLLPHMSTQIFDADFNDGMFNDWGVHHLHLGRAQHRRDARFVERTGPVLYAIVTDSTVYCIDVMAHGKGQKHAWTSQRIMQIVYDNWPELLRRSAFPDLIGGPPITDDKYKQARQGNVTAVVVLRDGMPLIGPGGGISTNGTGTRAVIDAHGKLSSLGQFEDNVREAIPEIVEQLRQRNMPVPPRLHMKLTFVNGLPFASCDDPPFRIPLTPQGSAAVAERQEADAST